MRTADLKRVEIKEIDDDAIEAYREQVLAGVAELGRPSPGTTQGYQGLRAAGQKTEQAGRQGAGADHPRRRRDVALRCDGWITVHRDAAIKQGATRALMRFIG